MPTPQNILYTTTNNFSPMVDAYTVTPSDATDLTNGVTRGLLIGGAGTISVIMASGNTVSMTIPATATGIILYVAVTRVRATGTTATNIVALY